MTAGARSGSTAGARAARAEALSTRLSDSCAAGGDCDALAPSWCSSALIVRTPRRCCTSSSASVLHMAAMGVPNISSRASRVSLALTRSPVSGEPGRTVSTCWARRPRSRCGWVGLLEICSTGTDCVILVPPGFLLLLLRRHMRFALRCSCRSSWTRLRAVVAGRRSGRLRSFAVRRSLFPVYTSLLLCGFKPMLGKGNIESSERVRLERWNSYSRVIAREPDQGRLRSGGLHRSSTRTAWCNRPG